MNLIKNLINLFIANTILFGFTIMMNAQNFEGKIVYVSKFMSKNLYSNAQYKSDTINVLIKEGMLKKWNTFSPSSEFYILNNKHYYVNLDFNTITLDISSDLNTENLEKRNSKLSQTRHQKKINGYDCDRYDITENTSLGTENSSFWITNDWKINFSWSYFIMSDLGIVLEMIHTFPHGSTTGSRIVTVSEIIPMKLDNKLFELPDYPIIEKNMSEKAKEYIQKSK